MYICVHIAYCLLPSAHRLVQKLMGKLGGAGADLGAMFVGGVMGGMQQQGSEIMDGMQQQQGYDVALGGMRQQHQGSGMRGAMMQQHTYSGGIDMGGMQQQHQPHDHDQGTVNVTTVNNMHMMKPMRPQGIAGGGAPKAKPPAKPAAPPSAFGDLWDGAR